MLVVWEPILPTDWEPPSSSTLARISDARARQFWDPDHEISNAMKERARRLPSGPAPNSAGGFYWDQAIVFAPHVRWEKDLSPTFWQGPVFEVIPHLATALSELTRSSEIGADHGETKAVRSGKPTLLCGFARDRFASRKSTAECCSPRLRGSALEFE